MIGLGFGFCCGLNVNVAVSWKLANLTPAKPAPAPMNAVTHHQAPTSTETLASATTSDLWRVACSGISVPPELVMSIELQVAGERYSPVISARSHELN